MTHAASIMGTFTNATMNKPLAASRLFHEYGRVIQNC